MFTTCHNLQENVPPYLWKHTLEEMMDVVTKLKYMAPMTRIFAIPWVTRIVEIFHEGKRPSSCCYLPYFFVNLTKVVATHKG